MTSKPKLTADEHADLGKRLAAVRNELQVLEVQLGNAYPRSGPQAAPARNLEKARKAIDKARCDLENALFHEHPEQAQTTVYYPPRESWAKAN
ncbi:MAG TPA: hypothetical protein DD420_35045 [Streptomyces sp.]|nr:hypothetical protein [Streptomyces sp.]